MTDTPNTPPSQNGYSAQQQTQWQQPSEPERPKERKRRAIVWWGGVGAGLLAAAGAVGLFYFSGIMRKPAAEKQKVENAFVFRIDGTDKQGRKAAFDFIILTDEYTWVKGSSGEVESRGQIIPGDDAAARVITPQIRESLTHATDLIAVGLASQEGEQSQEEDRAHRRAQTVSTWLNKVGNSSIPLWSLNLGQYSKTCKKQEDNDTSFERPLILVGVRSKDDGVDLGAALASGVSGKSNLPSRECYSRFDLASIR